jgi:hypothetical protein
MITERKLNAALAKIAHWKAGHSHGKPMSGLSIPATYYFDAKSLQQAKTARRRVHAAAFGG